MRPLQWYLAFQFGEFGSLNISSRLLSYLSSTRIDWSFYLLSCALNQECWLLSSRCLLNTNFLHGYVMMGYTVSQKTWVGSCSNGVAKMLFSFVISIALLLTYQLWYLQLSLVHILAGSQWLGHILVSKKILKIIVLF